MESNIQSAIIEYLERKKFIVWRLNSGDFFLPCGNGKTRRVRGLPKGTPDLMIIGDNGYIFFIEVKSKKGRLTKEQEETRTALQDREFDFYVFHSIDECMEIF